MDRGGGTGSSGPPWIGEGRACARRWGLGQPWRRGARGRRRRGGSGCAAGHYGPRRKHGRAARTTMRPMRASAAAGYGWGDGTTRRRRLGDGENFGEPVCAGGRERERVDVASAFVACLRVSGKAHLREKRRRRGGRRRRDLGGFKARASGLCERGLVAARVLGTRAGGGRAL